MRKFNLRQLGISMILILTLSLTNSQNLNAQSDAVQSTRPFTVILPTTYDPTMPAPLIIALHGFAQTGDKFEKYINLAPLTQAQGIIYVHPDGTFDNTGVRFWNATPECCNFHKPKIDDDAYIMAIINSVSQNYSIDQNRIYIIGHSNGGFMANRLACMHSDRIAAVVNIAGGNFSNLNLCKPLAPISMLEIWGTADETFKGNHILGKPILGAVKTFDYWAKLDHCSNLKEILPQKMNIDSKVSGDETTIVRYLNCPESTEIEFWQMLKSGHVPDFNSKFSSEVVKFLLDHPKNKTISNLDSSLIKNA